MIQLFVIIDCFKNVGLFCFLYEKEEEQQKFNRQSSFKKLCFQKYVLTIGKVFHHQNTKMSTNSQEEQLRKAKKLSHYPMQFFLSTLIFNMGMVFTLFLNIPMIKQTFYQGTFVHKHYVSHILSGRRSSVTCTYFPNGKSRLDTSLTTSRCSFRRRKNYFILTHFINT